MVEEPTPPLPPTASFAFAPASPVIGEAITLDGTASSCPDAPCTYEWSDDGGATRPASILWSLGTGISLSFSFLEVGTKYVRLVVTDAAGQTATVEHNVTISAPLISAPANTAPPTISGTSTEGDMLSATTGAWSNLPLTYTYQWQDCNSSGQSCSSIAGATSSTYTLTKEDVGSTMRVVVVANNLGGTGSASSAATATVAALPVTEPEPVSPPTNTAMPTVKGTTTEGQKLTTTNGGWTGNPTSYAYQWRHCNSSGKSCTNITGASASSYTLAQGDVGDTMRVTVTASNEGGSGSMSSPTTAKVTALAPPVEPTPPPPSEPPPVEPPSKQTDCIKVPSVCGYPDATNTGVPAGAILTSRSEEIAVTTPGTTIKDLALDGSIEVDANNTTIEDSDIVVNGTQSGCNSPCGGHGIWIKPGVTGTVVQDVTCHGGAPTGANVTEFCVQSNDSSTEVKRVHFYDCTTCMVGPGTWSDNFVDQTGAEIPQEHYEDIYYGGGAGPLVVNHNTMLNPQGQTAVVFTSVDFGNQTTITVTNNLMAGGGYMIYGGGSGTGGKVLGPVTITGNRFSREYYPGGGYYGVAAYFNEAVTSWSGNIWDDTLESVEE